MSKNKTPESKLAARCEATILKAQLTLDNHVERVQREPLEAMIWSKSVFQAAADLQVNRIVLDALTPEDTKATFASVREHAVNEVMRRSGNASSTSTSPTSNLADLCVLVAWSELIEAMKWM